MKELNHKYIAGLVIQAQHGDSDAFAELYGLTYNRVFNYACHYLRDTFLAQDAVQDVFILALRNLSKLNDPTLFIAWLNQISFRVCYDLCKKNQTNYGSITDPELMDILRDEKDSSNPEICSQKQDESDRLHAAIDALPVSEKQVIIMRYYNNMKIDDIARAMDISQSTVKRYINNGQAHLKATLKG